MSDRQTKKSRKARADGVETREAIIAAAEGEFAEKGFELASAREICRRAGVNSALLSRYFGSKDALYRIVAKRLFGDLGAPLAALADGVTDDASWRDAVREWVDDMLFMTIPTERAQKLCAALFRHEVTRPTKFHREFSDAFGKPVYEGLRALLSRKVKDSERLDLWCSSVWAQVSVYALADVEWHKAFRPRGAKARAWAKRVSDHICDQVFLSLGSQKEVR
ncbi:MAG: TetR/AcrR family transcriptional regulator [Kiritimatiellae bacterium]|nr:TetR/AcrR family transcriptional regulator [Kiritimatiellia bacterium]